MTSTKLNLTAIGAVLVLAATFALGFLRPGLLQLSQTQERVVQELDAVRDKQQTLGDVSRLYAGIVEQDLRVRDIHEQLPARRRFGEFLRDLSTHLEENGIADFLVEPRLPLAVDESKVPPTLEFVAGTHVLSVHLAFDCSIEQLVAFLDSVESLPRLSQVDHLQIRNHDADPGRVSVELTVIAYQNSEIFEECEPTEERTG